MKDNAMIERWNVIDSAAMAVAVEGILYRIENNSPLPFDFDDSIKQGIGFLEEAQNGGSIICGNPESNEFNGTLSPLKWSTDIYIRFEPPKEDKELYQKVVTTLKEYKKLLEKIKEEKKIGSDADRKTAKHAYNFFHELANELMKQADPVTETYSHQL